MDPTLLPVLSRFGLLSTAFLAGRIATFTTVLIPCISQSPPPLLARQWRTAWDSAQAAGPPTMIGATLLFVWLAGAQESWWNLYTVSALCVVGMVPYTLAFMTGFEVEILRREEGFRKEGGEVGGRDGGSGRDAGVGKVDPRVMGKEKTVVRTEKNMADTGVKDLTVHQLVESWGRLNLGRAGLMLMATVLAVVAEFSDVLL